MLTSAEVREILHISDPTLTRWRRKGLPCVRIAENAYRYDLQEIHAWMAAAKEPVPTMALGELVALNSFLASMAPVQLVVRGTPTTLQTWLPEELLRLAECPAGEERETALRDVLGFARVALAMNHMG